MLRLELLVEEAIGKERKKANMKQVKKVLAFFMALAMVVSVFSGTGMQVQADADKVVYFNNSVSGWSQVYAYVWGDGLTTKAIKGTKVEGTSRVKMTIPSKYSKILFKNTSGTSTWDKKTANTTIPSDGKNCFKPKTANNKSAGSWSVFTEPTKTPEVTPNANLDTATTTFYYDNSKTNWSNAYAYVLADNVAAEVYSGTKVTDKIYKYEVSTSFKKVLFKNVNSTSSWDKKTNDTQIGQNGQIFKTYSGDSNTDGYWENYSSSTPKPETMINFKYDNSKTKWSQVYAYVWGNGNPAKIYVGTSVGDNKYSFSVSSKYSNVLFKNVNSTSSWDRQTDDVLLADGEGMVFVTDSGDQKTAGKWMPEGEKEFKITGMYYDKYSPQQVNTPITMWALTENETSGWRYVYSRYYKITNLNTGKVEEKTGPGSSGGLIQWTPSEVGTYKIFVTITDAAGKTANYETTYEITAVPQPTEYRKLKFDNSKTNWSNVYAYVWCEDDKSVPAATIANKSMVGTEVAFEIPTTYRNILFKNTESGWDQQTADAGLPVADDYIFRTYSGDNKTAGYWDGEVTPPTTPPTPADTVTFNYDNSKTGYSNVFVYAWSDNAKAVMYSGKKNGNTYTFTIDKKYSKVLFKNVNSTSSWDKQTADAGTPIEGYTFVPYSSAHKTSGEWKDLRTVSNRVVKFDNSSVNWNNVFAYIWTEEDKSIPAKVIRPTNVQGSKYTFEIPSNFKNMIFKNTESNWEKQTVDAFVPAKDDMIYKTTGTDSHGKVTGNFVEDVVTKTVRRALTYGVGSEDGTSKRHYNDANTSANMYKSFTFDGQAMDSVSCKTDLTIDGFKKFVKETFADTKEGDVSYLSIACHGGSSGSICLGTGWTSMSGAQFRQLMDECIKGEVVILLDCCYSGKIIANETAVENGIGAVSDDFSTAFLKSFNAIETNSGELASDRFHVICASKPSESSYGTGRPEDVEIAVKHWQAGLGWDEVNDCRKATMEADANSDQKVTMAELFDYSYAKIVAEMSVQHPIVYPSNDSIIVGGRY